MTPNALTTRHALKINAKILAMYMILVDGKQSVKQQTTDQSANALKAGEEILMTNASNVSWIKQIFSLYFSSDDFAFFF